MNSVSSVVSRGSSKVYCQISIVVYRSHGSWTTQPLNELRLFREALRREISAAFRAKPTLVTCTVLQAEINTALRIYYFDTILSVLQAIGVFVQFTFFAAAAIPSTVIINGTADTRHFYTTRIIFVRNVPNASQGLAPGRVCQPSYYTKKCRVGDSLNS